MKEEQGYTIEEHEDYAVKVYDDGSFEMLEEYAEPSDTPTDDIKESLDDILFNLAYQEGKSVQECLYDVYIKGKRDGVSEYHSALMKAFAQTDLKSRGIHFDNVINMVFTEIKEDT